MNLSYLIGSRALKSFFPELKREPFDYDFLVKSESNFIDKIPGERIENHVIPPLYEFVDENGMHADVLLTLKCSHIFWDIKWDKHMFDIVFLFEKGAKVIKPLFYSLYSFWNEKHGENKRSDLQMDAKDFFNNALKTWDHDELHKLINPYPTYNKVLKDGAEVEVDENKFNALQYEEKLDLVREEVYVMAFERLNGRDYRVAYAWMLRKFIMHHAPLWEALFILENFKMLHKPSYNYVKKIQDELSGDSKRARR